MDTKPASIGPLELGGESLRTVRIGGEHYVPVQDVSRYLHDFSDRMHDLIARQQEQLAMVHTSLEVLVDVLSKQHPELARELLRTARIRDRPA